MPIIPKMPEILILNFAKGASRTGGKKLADQQMWKLGNQKMNSDKNHFLTGQTCRTNWIGQRERKETERFGRELGEILMKKGCKEGGVSLQRAYRKLIRILDDWYRKGI